MSGIIEDAAKTIANDALMYYQAGDDEYAALDNAIANNKDILDAATAQQKIDILNRANEIFTNMPKEHYHLPTSNTSGANTTSTRKESFTGWRDRTFGGDRFDFPIGGLMPTKAFTHPPSSPRENSGGKEIGLPIIIGGAVVGGIALFALIKLLKG